MLRTYRTTIIPFPVLVSLGLTFHLPLFGQTYTITDLNDPGDSYKLAHGMNSAGGMVGEYEPANILYVHAFWYQHGTSTDLGSLPGYIDAYAYGINDSNQIVGWCDAPLGIERAFLYANGSMQDLGTLGSNVGPPQGYSEAYAINNSAQIVGTATLTNTAINHAVLWMGGTKKDLGSLGGPTFNSSAFGLNNFGVIVGDTEVTNSVNVHAFSYSNNIMTDLLTLPGGSYSHASAVNDSGMIVGESDTVVGAGTATHAFLCSDGPGSMQDLGTLGGSQSSAYAINSAGHVVGYALDSNNISRAFLYDGAKMVNLNDLIPPGSDWTNLEAGVGINDAGQISGYGQFAGGVYHAFLLTPAGPLTVIITNPAPFATFVAPATFSVGASASDTAGTVTNVQFLINGSLLGNSTSIPYNATANNLLQGNYLLTAVASDNMGASATNNLSITVIAPLAPVTISNVFFGGSGLSFSFATQTGYTYEGQFTTPLASSNAWLTFTNLSGDGSVVNVTDSTPTNAQRYYRVVAH